MSEDKVTAWLAEAGQHAADEQRFALPDSGRWSCEDVPKLVRAVRAGLAGHDDLPVYCGADECDHPTPHALTSAGNEWDRNHPLGAGDVGRICLLTEVGRYCPACTTLVYEADAVGDSYVNAGDCIARPAITSALLGEVPADGS